MAPLQRDQLFQLRMTAAEKRMLGELSDKAGLTASDYVRQLIRDKHAEFRTEAHGFGPAPKRMPTAPKKTRSKK
jgi:hypothetical protein